MPEVTIVGAGIAGLTAALRLSERGYRVTLYEKDDYIGGKLGAFRDRSTGDLHEHSYHLYLNWYNNFWKIIADLGIRHHFEPRTTIRYLRKGEFPHTTALRDVGSPQTVITNLRAGVLSAPEMFIYAYSLIDLLSQDFRRDDFLDKISVNGFIHSRPYATSEAAEHHSRTLAKAFASQSFRTSAASYKRFIAYGYRHPSPMMWVLKGNVYDYLMKFLEARLLEHGCRIRKLTRVEKLIPDAAGRIHRLAFAELNEAPGRAARGGAVAARGVQEVDGFVILAVPPGALSRLVDDRVFEAAPTLGQVAHLNSEPMASLDLYFKRRLPDVPKDHVVLMDAQHDLTFIDNSALFPDKPNTFLNVVASESDQFSRLSKEAATQLIVDELQRYLPFDPDDIDDRRTYLQYNLEDQLFINEVGSWENRPGTTCSIPNLFLAGDYCRTVIDVVTIEGAVVSGLLAAESLRRRAGLGAPIECRAPEVYPEERIQALKLLLAPHAYAAKVWASALESGSSAFSMFSGKDR